MESDHSDGMVRFHLRMDHEKVVVIIEGGNVLFWGWVGGKGWKWGEGGVLLRKCRMIKAVIGDSKISMIWAEIKHKLLCLKWAVISHCSEGKQ